MTQPILLVDDDPIIVELLTTVLHRDGYDVVSATNGEQALNIARAGRRIGLVISDIVMPGITGIELCETLRTLIPDLKSILMSGYDMGLMADGWNAHFLQKPFYPEVLLEKVRDVLALQETGQSVEARA